MRFAVDVFVDGMPAFNRPLDLVGGEFSPGSIELGDASKNRHVPGEIKLIPVGFAGEFQMVLGDGGLGGIGNFTKISVLLAEFPEVREIRPRLIPKRPQRMILFLLIKTFEIQVGRVQVKFANRISNSDHGEPGEKRLHGASTAAFMSRHMGMGRRKGIQE